MGISKLQAFNKFTINLKNIFHYTNSLAYFELCPFKMSILE
jgi:hypothetical protein